MSVWYGVRRSYSIVIFDRYQFSSAVTIVAIMQETSF